MESVYTQVEDPTYVYIIGSWDTLSQHYEEWVPSEQNQELLKRAMGCVDVEWMFHVDLDQREKGTDMPFSAPVLLITRYFVHPGRRDEFSRMVEKKKDILSGHTVILQAAGGWRIEETETRGQEFVLLTGWRDVPSRDSFVQIENFHQDTGLGELLLDIDIKDATTLEL